MNEHRIGPLAIFVLLTSSFCVCPQRADGVTLALDKPAYQVSVGGSTAPRVEVVQFNVGCFCYYLQASTFDSSVATVSPSEIGPLTTDPTITSFTVRGVAEGVTTLRVVLYSVATPVLWVDATVTVQEGGCSLQFALDEAKSVIPNVSSLLGKLGRKDTLNLVRRFRDDVLKQTAEGQELVRLYYHHGGEVKRIMAVDPGLGVRAVRVVSEAIPSLCSAESAGGTVTFKPDTYSRGMVLIQEFEAHASPELRATLERLKSFVASRKRRSPGNMVAIDFGERVTSSKVAGYPVAGSLSLNQAIPQAGLPKLP